MPSDYMSNCWIAQVEDDEPITGEHTMEMLKFLQKHRTTVTLGLVKRSVHSIKALEDERSMSSQIESQKYELSEGDLMPVSNFLVTSPKPIKAPRDIKHMLQDPNFHLWKSATCEQYDKNHRLLLLSVPFPIY